MASRQNTISPAEISRRVAVLRRFRELLKAQRDRFRAYLDVLDRQKDVIEAGTTDDLIRHVELEEKIVADIFSIQKVIDPMEDLYRAAVRNDPARSAASDEKSEVMDLKTALEGLKTEAISRSHRNKELLSRRMTELREEIKTLRSNPYAKKKSAFPGSGTPSIVDIRG